VDGLDSTVGYVALGATALALIALLLCLTMAVRLRRVRNDQRLVLGERREDLVEHAAALARRVDELQDALESEGDAVAVRLEEAERRLDGAITKTSVLRYDAFNETSGRQSSTVALLDDLDNGVVITAILQREQARVYAKPVIGGRSELKLSPEEADAMERARRGEAAGGAADERAAG
jgi:hypothetical protein